MSDSAATWTTAHQTPPASTVFLSFLKFMSIELVRLFNHLILCCPLIHLPLIFPRIRVFSNELALRIRWPKYWSFSFSSSLPVNRQGWFPLGSTNDFFAVQGTLKSLQNHNLKASVLQCSTFFMFQLSRTYMNTGKTIAWTIWIFVDKVMSLLLNRLSRFVIDQVLFNFMAIVTIHSDFGAQENKISYFFHFPSICFLWSDRTRYHDLSYLNAEF